MNVATSPQTGGRRKTVVLLALLVPLVGLAAYLWTAPLRAERALKQASLEQLFALAKRQPNNPRIFYYEGLRLSALGQNGPAQATLARAATLDGDDEEVWVAWASVAGAQSGAQTAYQILTTFLRGHPRSAHAHYALALLYQQKGVHSRALEESSAAAKLSPDDPAVWRTVGVEAMAGDDEVRAETAFRRAVALAPHDWHNQVGLGNALARLRRNPEAMACFHEAARLAPNESLPRLALGSVMLDSAGTPADLNAAAIELLRAATLAPNTPGPFLILGQCLERQSHWPQARETLERAEALDPSNLHVHFELVRVYHALHLPADAAREAQRHADLGDYQNAALNLAMRGRAGDNQDSRLALGRLYAAHADYAKAADAYRSVLMHDPKSKDAQRELMALIQTHPAEVRQSVTLPGVGPAIGEAPAALLRDAALILTRGRPAEAERAYRDLLARRPALTGADRARAYEGLGFVLDNEGKTEDAFDAFHRAVTLDPRLPRAQASLARVYYRASLPDEAVKHLLIAVRESPRTPYYWHELGLCYGKSDIEFQQSEDAFRHAAALTPKDGQYQADLALMEWNNHEDDEAERTLRLALALAPNEPDINYHMANFLLKHEPDAARLREAGALLQKTLAADPNSPAALAGAGDLALKQGNPKAAVAALQKAVVSSPRSPELWYQLANAYQRTGDGARAVAARGTFTTLSEQHLKLVSVRGRVRQRLKDPALRLQLARLLTQDREYVQAINQYEMCLRLSPNDPTVAAEMAALEARLQATGEMPPVTAYDKMVRAAAQP